MTFDESELKLAVAHLAFDVYHFRCYARMHREGVLRSHPTCSQAVMYSLLLHLRVLLDFFFKKPKNDDCCVVHFRMLPGFAAAFPAPIKAPTPDEVEELRTNLHKWLAHLTATRWREKQPSMASYDHHFAAIEKLIETFNQALPEDFQKLFDERLSRWERVHPPRV